MESVAPKEGCGFVLNDDSWVACENMVSDVDMTKAMALGVENDVNIPNHVIDRSFLISPMDYIKHHDNIKYIVHSHISNDPKNDEQSVSDMIHQTATNVEWCVIVLNDNHKYSRHYLFGDVV